MSKKDITVLYLPGLAQVKDALRERAISWWPKRYNARLVPMNWEDQDETFEQKKRRVEDAIAEAEGKVVLIGESAGASMGIIVARENPEVSYIGFCGKIGGAKETGEHYYELIPTFRQALPMADEAKHSLSDTDRKRMMVVRAYRDLFLSKNDNIIPGVRDIVLPSVGHNLSIILGVTLLRFQLFRAIKILTK